ncbi:hypothetical protein, partial [Photobacterium gaetbulicola]|uniref:hypothetical protein n=1 Tax=Photobacterium gaetbulicola TaxID=1295392 RepID=UPI001E64C7BB
FMTRLHWCGNILSINLRHRVSPQIGFGNYICKRNEKDIWRYPIRPSDPVFVSALSTPQEAR